MKNTFAGIDLPESLQHTLAHMGYKEPTPIQQQAIPLAVEGRDILGTAQTGTGKTAAFVIPFIVRILQNHNSNALVILPTRELAIQVMGVISQMLGKQSKIKRAVLIGGASMHLQLRDLKNNPRIIVGTPGRINDHLKRSSLSLNKIDFLVLDETDKMLDMGFEVQIDAIMKYLSPERQTLMFSATMPNRIVKLASKYLKAPERITIGSVVSPVEKIKQEIILTNNGEKYGKLVSQLNQRSGSIIVFVKTKKGADKLAIKLRKENHSADSIHGDLRHHKRQKVIESFRNKQYRIMVATDVAARGLDIAHIEHVINYDLPQVPEDYIHRVGRTGRAGAEGAAVCLITPEDNGKWKAITKMLNPDEKPTYAKVDKKSKKRYVKPKSRTSGFKQHSTKKYSANS